MPIQAFNDSFLGNANVPSAGGRGSDASPASPAKAVGTPRLDYSADGTASPRVTVEVKQAEALSTPSGSDRHKGVQSFRDAL